MVRALGRYHTPPPPSLSLSPYLLTPSTQVTVKSAQLLKGLGAAAGALKAMIASTL